MTLQFCYSCDASLTQDAKFCGNCGAETVEGREIAWDRQRRERRQMVARGSAITLVFVGSLVSMMIIALGFDFQPEVAYSIFCGADLVICGLALWRLGGGSMRFSFGRAPDTKALLLGIAVPVVSLIIAYLYVSILPGGDGEIEAEETAIVTGLILTAMMPALVEEWMCRGVLWVALRPITTSGVTIFATAALFAFLHGLNGGFFLEFPHRFVMGLMLGWLRARTGSLWPCVLAHFLHNGFVVVVS